MYDVHLAWTFSGDPTSAPLNLSTGMDLTLNGVVYHCDHRRVWYADRGS